MNTSVGICFFCKEPRRRRRAVALPGVMARSLFPAWNAEVAFPARVCGPCLRARPDLRAADLDPEPEPATAVVTAPPAPATAAPTAVAARATRTARR